ncbi:hypothetical protein Tco_0653342 [Tanacetum coccineum]|uniref:Uncharacterized protein n=1 Tax=Tanacetum coccineum TaxID=301880 RepID=A0ABQ4X041_9ASTR
MAYPLPSDMAIILITSITVNGENAYELKGKFLDDLHNNAFSGTNGKDEVKHIEYYLKIIDPIKLSNVDHDKLRVVVFSISLVGVHEDGLIDCQRIITCGDEVEEEFSRSLTIFENSIYYQDLEWYEALEDSELKDEALQNKAIMEGLINDEESSNDCWKR